MRVVACEQCSVRDCSVVADLPVDQLRAFRACSSIALYRPRQIVFLEGTPASGLYVVCRGSVKVYQSNRFGRDHILGIAESGDILGELPLDSAEPYSVSAETLTDAQLCRLPREGIADVLQLHPMVGVRLVGALSKALSTARKKVRALALKPADSRLADLLLQLGDVGNGTAPRAVVPAYSRRELAEMIGVSTETAIRLLAQLKRKRMIDLQRRIIVITDADQLRRLANRDSLTDA